MTNSCPTRRYSDLPLRGRAGNRAAAGRPGAAVRWRGRGRRGRCRRGATAAGSNRASRRRRCIRAAGSSVRESCVQPHLRPAPETPALAAREDPAATVREVEGELLQFAASKRCTGRQPQVVFERDRTSVVWGTRGAERGDLGGGSHIKKTITTEKKKT